MRQIKRTCVGGDQLGAFSSIALDPVGVAEASGLDFLYGRINGGNGGASELSGVNNLRRASASRDLLQNYRREAVDHDFRWLRDLLPRNANFTRNDQFWRGELCRRKQIGAESRLLHLERPGLRSRDRDQLGYVIVLHDVEPVGPDHAEVEQQQDQQDLEAVAGGEGAPIHLAFRQQS